MNRYHPVVSTILLLFISAFLMSGCGDQATSSEHSLINISGPIKITGNNFSRSNGVIDGDGSSESPYIIQGHEIAVENVPAISISNSTAHFVIRNVRIRAERNAESSSIVHGIELNNVENGTIEDIQISGISGTGVYMINVDYITIRRSKITNVRNGIYARSVRDILIEDNEIAYLFRRGINLLFPLNGAIVRGNHVHHTATNGVGGEGIEAWGGDPSDRVTFENNRVHNIAEDGIEFVNVKNSFILNNSSHDNMGQGIDLFNGSDNNIISNNFVHGNQRTGILITNSDNNRVIENVVFGNSPAGIRFEKRGNDPTGSIRNVLAGFSPWSNGSDVVDDTGQNRIVYAGSSLNFPLSSENQIVSDYNKLPERVEYRFRHFRTEILAKFTDGTEHKTEKRSPPHLNIDLLPQEGILNYIIKTFNLNASADEVFLDLELERVSGAGAVNISLNQLPSNYTTYEIIYNETQIEEIRASGDLLNFSIDLVDEVSIVLRPKQ